SIHLHPISVLQPGGQAGYRDDGRDPQLARDDRRMRQHAPPLDDESGGRWEQRDPAGIGPLGDENRILSEDRGRRLPDDADGAAAGSRTTRTGPRRTPAEPPTPRCSPASTRTCPDGATIGVAARDRLAAPSVSKRGGGACSAVHRVSSAWRTRTSASRSVVTA